MKNKIMWFYDYVGVYAVLFALKHLSIFSKAKVTYGVHREQREVWVWLNYTKDSVRHMASFNGLPADVVHPLITIGETIRQDKKP